MEKTALEILAETTKNLFRARMNFLAAVRTECIPPPVNEWEPSEKFEEKYIHEYSIVGNSGKPQLEI
jgi:hypothetical protein